MVPRIGFAFSSALLAAASAHAGQLTSATWLQVTRRRRHAHAGLAREDQHRRNLAQRRIAGFTNLVLSFVPESGSLLLLGAGVLALGHATRQRPT